MQSQENTLHSTDNCTNTQQNSSHTQDNVDYFPIRNHAFLEVSCQNQNTLGYLDSGASHNIMRYAFFELLTNVKLVHDHTISHFTSASGELMKCEGAVYVELEIGNRKLRERFFVVKSLCHSLILGRSFMRKNNVKLCFEDMVVQIPRNKEHPMYSLHEVSIPPRSNKIVHVYVNDKSISKLNSTTCSWPAKVTHVHQEGNPNYTLFPRMTQLCDITEGETQIALINDSDYPINIKSGKQIANCQPVEHEYFTDPLQIQPLLKEQLDKVHEHEGVTHSEQDYINEISKLDLTDSVFTESEKEQIRQMLFEERGALAVGRELGLLNNGFRYEIKMQENHQVYNARPYRLSPKESQFMKQQLDELMTQGVVARSLSNYSSPSFLVRKPGKPGNKSEDFRLVIDLRTHNLNCKTEKYGLPHIQDNITNLKVTKFKYKSLLDLSQSFFQIGLHPNSFHLTGFKIDKLGSFCMQRMIMGHKNSSEIFQCVLDNLFDPTLKDNMAVIVDDILALGESFQIHLETLRYILRTIRVSGLKLKIEKLKLGKSQLNYMGQVLTDNGVRISDDKIKSVVDCPAPTDLSSLRRYMGMLNFSRHYIKSFATLARPLTRLLKGSNKGSFTLNDEQLKSFNALKDALVNAPVLGQIDYDKQLIVTSDSSDFAGGACLSQLDSAGKERVIAYYSRSYDRHELNYSITEKEALALVTAVKKWAPYLRYNHFLARSDHSPLLSLFKRLPDAQTAMSRIQRWAAYLAQFEFDLIHLGGSTSKMSVADWLSRDTVEKPDANTLREARLTNPYKLSEEEAECTYCSPIQSHEHDDQLQSEGNVDQIPTKAGKQVAGHFIPQEVLIEKLSSFTPISIPHDRIRKLQVEDGYCGDLINYLESGKLPSVKAKAKSLLVHADSHIMHQGLLYHLDVGNAQPDRCVVQLVVPELLQGWVLLDIHGTAHLGPLAMYNLLRTQFYFDKAYTKCIHYFENCPQCEMNRTQLKPYRAPLQNVQYANAPAQQLHIDHFGPIVIDSKRKMQYKYGLIIVDGYSLLNAVVPVMSTTAKETAEVLLNNWFYVHSFPRAIHHDRHQSFVSQVMNYLNSKLHIKVYISSARHAQSNGKAEAVVKKISKSLKMAMNKHGGDWYKHLPAISFAHNCVPKESLGGYSSFLIHHGRIPSLPISLALLQPDKQNRTPRQYLVEVLKSMGTFKQHMTRGRQEYIARMKKNYDKSVNVPRDLELGSFVYMSAPDTSSPYKHIRRLRIDHDGPYVVIDMSNDKRLVRLMNVATFDVMKNWVALDRIRVSKFGIHPPHFEPLKEIMPDGCPIPDQFISMQNNQASEQEITSPAQDSANTQTDTTDTTDQQPTQSIASPDFDDPVCYAKVPQPVRITRHTKLNQPIFREVGQFLRKKVRDNQDYVKVLFKGDHPSKATWVPVADLNECARREVQISCLRPVYKQKFRNTQTTEQCIASLFPG